MLEGKRRNGRFGTFITALLTSLGVGAVLFFLVSGYVTKTAPIPQTQQGGTQSVVPKPQQLVAEVPAAPQPATGAAKTALPGVVGISVLKVESGSIFNKSVDETWGVGSGVVVSPDGYILTNNHVAGGTTKQIIVSFSNGNNENGTTVWADPVLDLAVVKVNRSGLNTIPIGDSDALQIGEPAIAIGNPMGLQFKSTVTSGIISALNRTIKIGTTEQDTNFMEDLIQTDASINPGNSGGPLINSQGQVVGINTIKVTTAEGMGFAIPINIAKPIIRQLVDRGEFIEPYLGVFAYDSEVIPYLDSNLRLDKGIYLANIDSNGPAAKSGLKVGNIITQVDGIAMNTMMQLRIYLYSKRPEDTINVMYIDNGNTAKVSVKLSAKLDKGLLTR